MEAMMKEIEITKINTQQFVELPKKKNPVGCKQAFRKNESNIRKGGWKVQGTVNNKGILTKERGG